MSQLQNVEEDSLASYSILLHFTEYPIFLLKLCTLVFATHNERRSGGEGIILYILFTEYFVFLYKLGTLVFATDRVKRETEKGGEGGGYYSVHIHLTQYPRPGVPSSEAGV